MDTWLIIVVAVAILVFAALFLLSLTRRGNKTRQQRVEARARIAEADRHDAAADQRVDVAVQRGDDLLLDRVGVGVAHRTPAAP